MTAIDTQTGYMYGGERAVHEARGQGFPLQDLTEAQWRKLYPLDPLERLKHLPPVPVDPGPTVRVRTEWEQQYDRIEESRRRAQ